jgi:hypothetical protein
MGGVLMDAPQAFMSIAELGLTVRMKGDWGFALSPASEITPELRAAIKEHKPQIVCLLAEEAVLQAAVEGLGLDPDHRPPWSPEMIEAYESGDPAALAEAMEKYVKVWRDWDVIEAMLSNNATGVIEGEDGLLVILPEDKS